MQIEHGFHNPRINHTPPQKHRTVESVRISGYSHNMSNGKNPGLSNDFLPFHLISSGSKPNDSGERLNGIQEVSGSIPLISTNRV